VSATILCEKTGHIIGNVLETNTGLFYHYVNAETIGTTWHVHINQSTTTVHNIGNHKCH